MLAWPFALPDPEPARAPIVKAGIIAVPCEMLGDIVSLIESENGLRILSSMDAKEECTVRLVLTGDALPDECRYDAGPLREVKITVTKRTRGSICLNEIVDIQVA